MAGELTSRTTKRLFCQPQPNLPGTRPALSSPGLFIPPLKDITCLFLEFPALSINNRTLMICMPTYFFCVFVAFSKVYYVYLSICISFYSPIAVYVYMSINLSTCLYVYLFICLYFFLLSNFNSLFFSVFLCVLFLL